MNYKDKFYTKYETTHVLPRKGAVTTDILKSRSKIWEKTYSKYLPDNKDARIIDLGCGYGSIVWWLQQAGFANTSGIDISEEQIETGQKLGISSIVKADIKEYLQDKKTCYDVIIARDIIEHFTKAEIVDILSLCYESLTKKGIMIIQVPNAESPFGGRNRYGDFSHEVAFATNSISQLLRVIGFGEIEIHPHEPILIVQPVALIRYLLWKFLKVWYKFCLWVELGSLSRPSQVSLNIIVVATKGNKKQS